MKRYIKPPANYNFKESSDFKVLVSNSDHIEDPNLLLFIQKSHYHIDYVPRKHDLEDNKFRVPLEENDSINWTNFDLQSKKFKSLSELEDFVELESESNYFMLVHLLNLEISYISIPFSYRVRGLYEELESDMRDYKLKKILEK